VSALLEPGLFHARHRRQFFELLEVFLRSTHLPAYLAAAFAKRMSRLALSAPPHGCMLAIGFTHNLLRRHPGCCVLLHRQHAREGLTSGSDPYLPDEADPAKCRALESSLWELDTLRSHYSPSVSRFVAVLDRDLTDKRKTLDVELAPLAASSYASMLGEELGRRLKAVPLAFYTADTEPKGLWGARLGELDAPVDE
jgi:U3 small nucleolar RNA-associated protein 19